jgi:hypothetical protein
MWQLVKAFVTATFTLAVAFSTTVAAEAGHGHQASGVVHGCRYWVQVSREGFPGEQASRMCHVGNVVDWLGAVPEAEVSAQAPQVALDDSFTVTVYLATKTFPDVPLPVPPSGSKTLLTERVYPVSEAGPVALVPSRSVFHGPGPYPRWVVRAGWRYLDPMDRVPAVLTRLGVLQPIASGLTPTPTATATAPTTGSSRPGPDLVTLLFVLAILVFVGTAVRRNIGRTRPIPDGLGHHSEPSHHG